MPSLSALKSYLDDLVDRYEDPSFIEHDPISVPHAFDDPRDQEVIGLYAALLAWGRRETVLNKMEELCERMDYAPYDFVRGFDPNRDAAALDGFVHRTFQPEDAFWFTRNLSAALDRHGSVENLFADHMPGASRQADAAAHPVADASPSHKKTGRTSRSEDVSASGETPWPQDVPRHAGPAIQGFSTAIMAMHRNTPQRLQKHLARPQAGSACKRLNMYLRWMVRSGPVDLGIWSRIQPEQLLLPLDVHAGRQARDLGLVSRKSNDWKAVCRLTEACRLFAPDDPARYDFAFFGVGAQDDSLDADFTGDNKLDRSSLPTPRYERW
jgi:uncharacterized protein (TIGR02757 family)